MALPYALKGISKLTGSDDDDDDGRAAPGHGERPANADPAVDRRRGPGQGRLQPVDAVRGLAAIHAPGRERRAGRRRDGGFDQDLGDHQALRGRDRRAAPRRAHRVGREEGLPQRRRHLPRAGPAADPDRGDPRRRARRPAREGRPRDAFTKRAVRGDLHRFKAFAELDEEAEGGWRGTIRGRRGQAPHGPRRNGSAPRKSSKSGARK